MSPAYGNLPSAAKYAGVCKRTMQKWLQAGLSHAKMPTGKVLIKFADVDEYIAKFKVNENKVDQIVNSLLKDF